MSDRRKGTSAAARAQVSVSREARVLAVHALARSARESREDAVRCRELAQDAAKRDAATMVEVWTRHAASHDADSASFMAVVDFLESLELP